ncbi:hypothetical protein [Bradyrhizobium sp. SYSU BS000235]|uniref:hypothetical protein n=1 Tax=Bradyrhizobium sp. SYSU BS000235 TaxID=3411332 RepID=UPI003C776C36
MRLRAKIRNVTGNTSHLRGGTTAEAFNMTSLPDPRAVEIVEQEGSFYLLRLDKRDECIADTWHQTVEAAKAQAKFEYEIKEVDWIVANDGLSARP